MAAVSHNWQSHVLIILVTVECLLEADREILELRFGSQARLHQLGLHLNFVLKVGKRGAFEVTLVILRRDCRARVVVIGALEFVEGSRLRHVVLVLIFHATLLVERHHIL
jgi:hypothetical protein